MKRWVSRVCCTERIFVPLSSFSARACRWLTERTVAAQSHGSPAAELMRTVMPMTMVS